VDDIELRLAQCEERRMRILRGDLAIGIMPIAEAEQMVEIYRALGDAGVAEAFVGLGSYHLDPNGVHPSIEDAAECACRAIVLGSLPGRDLLRRVLPALHAEELSDPPHAAGAARAIDAALADDTSGRAHYLAGLIAFHGFGRPKDLDACLRLQEEAAARGDTDAMFELYVLLSTGTGVAKDETAALAWCTKAAELDHPRACYNMGAFAATGRGVPLDEAAAKRWYERASDAGNGRATATLGYMLLSGSEADQARAEELFGLAEDQGFDVEGFLAQLGL
jgi:TPR repeat protein